ncbi:MAG: 1,4-alpha-glucan branching protein GlgB [Deltaproteobacteria bacterium]|nr:1,4-alpha-glucan branching protein GlgB [Deltaproteobacteria bacterium]
MVLAGLTCKRGHVSGPEIRPPHRLTELDLYLFNEGRHQRLYEKLGAHLTTHGGESGVEFAVWAPNAERVSVIGDFNGWDPARHCLASQATSGIWAGFLPGVEKSARYKFHIDSREAAYQVDKADPFAFWSETPPKTASVVWDLDYTWNDDAWMASRRQKQSLDAPMSIYEVHLGSWRRDPADPARLLSYRELAPMLADHVQHAGFTHIELLPIMEHPFYGSWGYQTTSYFAPTSRHGTPQDLMFMIDYLHQRGIGVILDWVPSHFPNDEHGPGFFDGTHLFEHADPRKGYHPDWNSLIFNYGRNEVRAFLLSSALFWLDKYRADALRVDAVASMLYLDYSRKEGEWLPNEHGGRENLEAISLLREVNTAAYTAQPDVQTIAEESTAWPMVSRPVHAGGLGFGYKWDMGWMHDTLKYLAREPVHRKHHHGELTFRMIYAFHENFVLSLSHDEVVHGKGSLAHKMPGDAWQKLAQLRLLFGYMYGQPGKKLLFMGGEFGQWDEWSHEKSLDWHLLEQAPHAGILKLVGDLNRVYRGEPALYQLDCQPSGFEWVWADDADNSVLSFLRRPRNGAPVLAIYNFTPVPRHGYRLGVPTGGGWHEILNTDGRPYGGSGLNNSGRIEASTEPMHGRPFCLQLTVPPLGAVFMKPIAGG